MDRFTLNQFLQIPMHTDFENFYITDTDLQNWITYRYQYLFWYIFYGLVPNIAQSHSNSQSVWPILVKALSPWPKTCLIISRKEWLLKFSYQVQRGDLVSVITCNFWPMFTETNSIRYLQFLTLPIPIPVFTFEYHTDTDTDFAKNTD